MKVAGTRSPWYPVLLVAMIFLLVAPAISGCQSSPSRSAAPADSGPEPRNANRQSPAVPPKTGSNVPPDEGQQALDFHNARRRDVGAPALVWSDALAANAQTWANHLANDSDCQLIHQQNNS